MRYDLHCHSFYSDGTCSPKELIEKAKAEGLAGLSITDHDTFQAYFDVKDCGLRIIPGIEVSAEFEGKSIHVLGYSFDPNDADFQAFCLKQRVLRLERLDQMLKLLEKQGVPLDRALVVTTDDPNHTFGRVHVALALIKQGYIKDVYQAFKRYIGDGKPCYVSGFKCSVQEAIDAIHKAKGFAVLAHPHLIKSRSLVKRLLALNFDGIEAYYGRFSPDVNEHWVQRAKDKNMFVTGGSDFHGLPKHEGVLGSQTAPMEVFEKLAYEL